MKNLITLFTLTISATLFAGQMHSNHSVLNIQLWNDTQFKVKVNDILYGTSSHFQKTGMQAGDHHVKVIGSAPDPYGCGSVKKVYYNGFVHIPSCAEVTVRIDRYGRIDRHVRKQHSQINSGPNYASKGGNYYHSGQNTYTDPLPCHNGNSGQLVNYYDSYQAMQRPQFERLIYAIENTSFDASRLEIARSSIQQNYLTANQVAAVMQKFSFESNRLKFAKFAYYKTVDPENYFVVHEAFQFIGSSRKLNDYINKG